MTDNTQSVLATGANTGNGIVKGAVATENAAEIYKDIIDLPHHVSRRHRPMPLEERAAQFAAFDALKEAAKPESKLNRAETDD